MKHTKIVVTCHGSPEVLQPISEDLPAPEPGFARLRVLAAGVSGYDLMLRRAGGLPGFPKPPFCPGVDVVGIIDHIEPGPESEPMDGVAKGALVAATTFSAGSRGGYAEYINLAVDDLVPVPPGVDPAAAVCLVANYLTAHMVMFRTAKCRKGERVLIHGGGGGVGSALLDLGRLAELEMYSTASPRNHALVESFGAVPIDYRSEDFVAAVRSRTDNGVDAVLDGVGGYRQLIRSRRCLRRGGRLAWYGMAATKEKGLKSIAGSMAAAAVCGLIPRGRRFLSVPDLATETWLREELARMLALLASGSLQPVVADRIPLREAGRAHEMLEAGKCGGKFVLVNNP